jgi:hypothetical protein
MNEYERVELQNLKSELRERIAEYRADLAYLKDDARKNRGRMDYNLLGDLDEDMEVIRKVSAQIAAIETKRDVLARLVS